MYSDHSCEKLTARERAMQGCDAPSLQGLIWPVGDGEFSDRCPQSRVEPESVAWINAHFFFSKGMLPNPERGGYLNQSTKWYTAMLAIENASVAVQERLQDEQKAELDKSRTHSRGVM